MTDSEIRERVTHLEEMLEAAETRPEVVEVVQGLLEIYGEALRRIVHGADPKSDELLSHLMMLHDIEPPTLLQITPLRHASLAS